jgi:hypothetical protein
VQDKADGREKVALATAIATDNHIVARAEGTKDGLVPIRLEAVDCQLFDVHYSGRLLEPLTWLDLS